MFNSNSPELIQTEGILLSTFPPDDMAFPSAHLDYSLDGQFDIFAHHVVRGLDPDDRRTVYFAVLVQNPSNETVHLDLLQAATYLSQEAPFNDLPSYVANPLGRTYAGPGSRTMNDILRGERQAQWPAVVSIPPGQTKLLMNLPIPLRRLTVPTDGTLAPGSILLPPMEEPKEEEEDESPSTSTSTAESDRPLPSNGRTVMMHVTSSGPVYVASLAMYAPKTADGKNERVPTLAEWQQLLTQGGLAGPRDIAPTPPNALSFSRFFYGRVSGVSQGSEWQAQLTDSPESSELEIPDLGDSLSYVISTVDYNTFGTGQIQSAPMLVRYPDTAYRSHGNYGVKYDLTMPLYNPTNETRKVAILFQTPLQDESALNFLQFLNPTDPQIFFRGTVRLRYIDDLGLYQTRYLHLVQRRGQEGEPLINLSMPAGDRRLVQVEFLYPPDATPPQVLTVQTVE
jgi:hypothetical protein